MSLVSYKISTDKLPQYMFDHIFNELMPDTKNFNLTLHRILARDFRTGINIMPRIGPFNMSPVIVQSAMFKAIASLADTLPLLREMMKDVGECKLLGAMERGHVPNIRDVTNRLSNLRDDLRMQRNQMEDNPEPSLFDLIELEKVLRRLSLVDNLASTMHLASFDSPMYQADHNGTIAKYAIAIRAAAQAKWYPGTNEVLVPTKAERKEWASDFARSFLEHYEATPTIGWDFH